MVLSVMHEAGRGNSFQNESLHRCARLFLTPLQQSMVYPEQQLNRRSSLTQLTDRGSKHQIVNPWMPALRTPGSSANLQQIATLWYDVSERTNKILPEYNHPVQRASTYQSTATDDDNAPHPYASPGGSHGRTRVQHGNHNKLTNNCTHDACSQQVSCNSCNDDDDEDDDDKAHLFPKGDLTRPPDTSTRDAPILLMWSTAIC